MIELLVKMIRDIHLLGQLLQFASRRKDFLQQDLGEPIPGRSSQDLFACFVVTMHWMNETYASHEQIMPTDVDVVNEKIQPKFEQ